MAQSGIVAVGVVAALAVLIAPRLQGDHNGTPAPSHDVAASTIADELLAIKTEAEQLRAEILAAQPAPAPKPVRPPEAAPSVDEELERAAYLIVYQADRYHRELHMPQSAVTSYRQTINPETIKIRFPTLAIA